MESIRTSIGEVDAPLDLEEQQERVGEEDEEEQWQLENTHQGKCEYAANICIYILFFPITITYLYVMSVRGLIQSIDWQSMTAGQRVVEGGRVFYWSVCALCIAFVAASILFIVFNAIYCALTLQSNADCIVL